MDLVVNIVTKLMMSKTEAMKDIAAQCKHNKAMFVFYVFQTFNQHT